MDLMETLKQPIACADVVPYRMISRVAEQCPHSLNWIVEFLRVDGLANKTGDALSPGCVSTEETACAFPSPNRIWTLKIHASRIKDHVPAYKLDVRVLNATYRKRPSSHLLSVMVDCKNNDWYSRERRHLIHFDLRT